MDYPKQNSTNFSLITYNILKSIKYNENKEILKYSQFIPYKYFTTNKKARGLLVYHDVGFGKTWIAVSIAEQLIKDNINKKIIILAPKSLISNFRDNIIKYRDSIKNKNKKFENYKFINLGSKLMYKKIQDHKIEEDPNLYDSKIKEFSINIEKQGGLENSLLIIDEAHNFFNSISNGSTNAVKLYEEILKTEDIKILFLTGTPMINSPYELVPCYNMLKGYIFSPNDKERYTLLPEIYEDFNKYFIDNKKKIIKNKKFFQNRILGLTTYYGNKYVDKLNENFPIEYELKVEKIPMSDQQFIRYKFYRDLEREETAFKQIKNNKMANKFNKSSSSISSYRVKSRQVSNFLFPNYAIERKGKKVIKHINMIKKDDLKNLNIFSPKIERIINNIKKKPNQLGIIYSNFVKNEGLAILEKILNINGYYNWIKKKTNYDIKNIYGDIDTITDIQEKDNTNIKYYGVISGDININQRNEIVKIFSNNNNEHGEIMSLLLISSTGAEGLDLKNVRHVHIMEPFWNYSRIKQIIARAVRYKSHINLPKNEQNVQPYIYLSVYPNNLSKKLKKDKYTTDEDIYINSLNNKKIIDSFLLSMIESSMDCKIFVERSSDKIKKNINCKVCLPNNEKLYDTILGIKSFIIDPCLSLEKIKVKVNEYEDKLTGEKYYYTLVNNLPKIFIKKKGIDGYVEFPINNPMHPKILKKIIFKNKINFDNKIKYGGYNIKLYNSSLDIFNNR